jgi:hypothetical protein
MLDQRVILRTKKGRIQSFFAVYDLGPPPPSASITEHRPAQYSTEISKSKREGREGSHCRISADVKRRGGTTPKSKGTPRDLSL